MKEAISEIRNFIKSNFNNKDYEGAIPRTPDSSYKPYAVKKSFFSEIVLNNEISKGSSVCFIDGGNARLIDSSDLSLSLVRIAYSTYKDNKRIDFKRLDFYVLSYVFNDSSLNDSFFKTKIFFDSEKFPEFNGILPSEDSLSFSFFDESLKDGLGSPKISRIGDIARRFSELSLGRYVISKLSSGDFIVFDGSLKAVSTNEEKYLEAVYNEALSKGVSVSGICKTSSLISDNGISFLSVLDRFSQKGIWSYNPVFDINSSKHKVEMFFLRLHEKSKYVFKFEIYKPQKNNAEFLFAVLAKNSIDPVFLGYPYGLIDADNLARISNQETEYHKTIIRSKLGNLLEGIENNSNAHGILDKISF